MDKQDKNFEKYFKIGKITENEETKLRNLIGKYKDVCVIDGTKLG